MWTRSCAAPRSQSGPCPAPDSDDPSSRSEQVGRVDAARTEQGAQLAEPRPLDLTDALAGQAQALPDRLELLGRVALEAEAATQHRPLVGRQVVEHRDQIGALPEERDER